MASSPELRLHQLLYEAPIEAARAALAGVGLQLTNPLTEEQVLALDQINDIAIGRCTFEPSNVYLGDVLGAPLFRLDTVQTPENFTSDLAMQFGRGKISDTEYVHRVLYAPVRSLRFSLMHLPTASRQAQTDCAILPDEDTSWLVLRESDVQRLSDQVPAAKDIIDFGDYPALNLLRRYKPSAVERLTPEECATLVDAIENTPYTF